MVVLVEEDDVGDADDGIVLTEREREALAGLAESIGDPWLAGQLAGMEKAAAPARRPRRMPAALSRLAGWVGLLLVVAGASLAATTFTHSTAVAAVGLVVMGAGIWRLAVDRGDQIARRLQRRLQPGPKEPAPKDPAGGEAA